MHSFLIVSRALLLPLLPLIHLSILIFATHFFTCSLIAQHFEPRAFYSHSIKFSLQFKIILESHRTPETLLHSNHPSLIRWITSSLILLSWWMI